MSRVYWLSLEQRDLAGSSGGAQPEFLEAAAGDPSRRDFLKLVGFSVAGAAAASCSPAPVRQEIPYVAQPEGIVPGDAVSYATTCGGCTAGCGLLVKTRDGRPIKVEGCPDHPISAGGVCSVGQAALLGLYDNLRFRSPSLGGAQTSWPEIDTALMARFDAIRQAGGAVRVLTPTVHSPTLRRGIAAFLASFGDGEHVEYDALSASAVLDAHEATHGVRAFPRYFFDRAEVVVSFDADFLGTWVSPAEYTRGYALRRRPEGGSARGWHAQIESRVSLAGGKADRRIALPPDEIAALAFDVAAIVEQGSGGSGLASELAQRLMAAPGRSIVLSGLQDLPAQVACNRINAALGNYGRTLDIAQPSNQRRGSDRAVARLLDDAAAGRIAALLVWHTNPVFDLPGGSAVSKVPLLVSLAERPDETSAAAHAVCPDHHAFESWADAEPVAGSYGLTQPLVRPLGDTRAFLETLAAWSGAPRPALDQVRETWRDTVCPVDHRGSDFEQFWAESVQTGYAAGDALAPAEVRARSAAELDAALMARPAVSADAIRLTLYHKPAILGGEHAYNPMLQELPDPISKVVWDNYACLGPTLAARLQLATGGVARIGTAAASLELPVLVQPGQDEQTVAIALGYGGQITERFQGFGHHWFRSRPTVGPNGRVGLNAAPLIVPDRGLLRRHAADVQIAAAGRTQPLACTQEHHTLSVPANLSFGPPAPRPIVQEISTAALAAAAPEADGGEAGAHAGGDLWAAHPMPGHRWGMAVDVDACTGCGACVVGCQVENNIPVVGKDEVGRNREMHWLRIDRYYMEDESGLHVANQPMFCQHCEHAPCETVCPVLATVHSSEGLNQQIYNRCVGTRYCANNCPYKVRRFNWFAYDHGEGTEQLASNPDVTIRSRGVMEKCTMCVQRIQEGKIAAKRRGEPLRDGEIQTACQQSCPAHAIVFGDLNDPSSEVSRLSGGRRAYKVLEELQVKPAVSYLKIVRDARPAATATEIAHHG
ncbi:MAG: Fe-S cluster-containing hydrogenase [Acidobacteria bacterium]|nr:Fe-S cluster-containing hydrogenase [Acidobacteriota bacterium]